MKVRRDDPITNEAITWLRQYEQYLDSDTNVQNSMSIEEVHNRLRKRGIDIDKFHSDLSTLLKPQQPILAEDDVTLASRIGSFIAKIIENWRTSLRRRIIWQSPPMSLWTKELEDLASDILQQKKEFRVARAADFLTKKENFIIDSNSRIEFALSWNQGEGESPDYVKIEWKLDTEDIRELWCSFLHPENSTILVEFPLGNRKEGDETFTSEELGFDPSPEKWGFSILLREPKK